ncbi:Flagellar basal-body rod protein FlgG [Thalassoglobus neptunius]|uniref:Flagellar basal-body rod protein FlgG n=1 Tax=Thalassoglobus neptunius TaxID=1938619 RepID=A0A5C5VX83_9PLAN|nr:flagellar hook basal-body protein [Thalassoglobus neptunius]TWT43020.1 Flagellar basal-body rod protein FlgG [Thalassoglobus neptunius]
MLHGLYSSAVAMESSARHHEAIAHNLAHAQLPGHRRMQMRQGTFDDSVHETREQLAARSLPGLRGGNLSIDFTPGQSKPTGVPLDLAIEGEEFFEVETPDGLRYTRNGSFRLDDEGTLVTHEGYVVQGTQGRLSFSLPASLDELAVQEDGRLFSGQRLVGRVKAVTFPDLQQLTPSGGTLFANRGGQRPTIADSTIRQGFLEQSNVSVTRELVDMISSQRRHEAAARSLETLTDAIQRHTQADGGN